MDEDPAGGTRIIQKFKPQLIDALCGDADFVLQHCHSLRLLSKREYEHVKATAVPSEKVRDILDFVMTKNSKCVQSFLDLLKKNEMQETFQKLGFLKKLPQSKPQTAEKKKTKRKGNLPAEEVPLKQPRKTSSGMVTEKQLMLVARHIGSSWKEVGRAVLEISTTRLEQIMEENPRNLRECVFTMLRDWTMREREKATADRLHSLLTQEENAVVPGSIDFLLEGN
ncbi:ankyrin-3 [Colossoma macropomum]|uniref:ankyrin-3 n=1 Tax=Colossoma macropomum TaxID=42526 RepID=UPI001863B4E8|nr:ankyrin-3 [Colossoma macropomum]XP_036447616.1 ankyrin-3 [Colossoma macropomum]